jgi:hypothetical protein
MGSMSSSDAAPLPRLGEVFFDVRGNSRSMRLSWYADTGVAVFSIWQGGMCTGTFRLAIADLPRMVETLQRGPAGQRPDRGGDRAVPATPESQGPPLAPVPPLADTLGGPRTGVAEYQLDDDPRSVSTQYLPGAGDYGTGPPDHGSSARGFPAGRPAAAAAAPEYLAGPPGQRAPAPDYLAGPPDQRAPAPDYPAGPPDQRAPAPDYLAGPPDQRAPAPDYPAGPPAYPAPPPGYAADPPRYPADRPDYLADPPGHRAGPPEGTAALAEARAGSPSYPSGPADYQPEPPAHRADYLAARPGPAPEGPPRHEDPLDPGARPGSWNPGADHAYRGGTDAAAYPEHPYPGRAGPADYRGESPASHYLAGTSASGDGDAPGRSGADYPEHYAVTVTDDNPHGPAPDSFPYGRPPAGRRAASRHAAPDTPFD